jgi:sigma-B regulation protein RsbU (phosphoserine phosphatase)
MVRKTTSRRLFITLLLAQIDPANRRLRIGTAGHPPLLRCRNGEITELGAHAMPLGTGLGGDFSDVETDFQPGDLLVAYTDGLTETANSRDELYGEERLFGCLRRAGSDKSSRRVREAILSDVWTFKGDNEQNDDLTLIVMRAT